MVENVKEEYGFNKALEVLNFSKGTWDYHENKKVIKEEKYKHLKELLDEIVEEYPEYGGRKISEELESGYGYNHSRELIYELMRIWGLKQEKAARNTDKSGYRKAIEEAGHDANLVRDLENVGLFEVAYTDFTELRYAGGNHKAKLISIIGHTSKLVFGWALGKTRGDEMALRAWDRAKRTYEELGVDREGLILHQDRDSVFTGEEWVNRLLVEEKVSLSYSMRGAKGNTYMESFNGHFKNPVESIFVTSETLERLRDNVAERVEYWNRKRRHGSIENRTPMEFIEEES